MVKALTVQLKNTTFSAQKGCKLATPTPGISALHEYGKDSLNNVDAARTTMSNSSVQTAFRQASLIWELVVALWGSLPEFDQLEGRLVMSLPVLY